MLIRCEECQKIYDFEANDGFCPKCGCYNNISHSDAQRLERARDARAASRDRAESRRQRARLENSDGQSKSLCDAESETTYMAGEYAPDCMEEEHSAAHHHTGGANIEARETVGSTANSGSRPVSAGPTVSDPSQNAHTPRRKSGGLVGWIVFIMFIIQIIVSLTER